MGGSVRWLCIVKMKDKLKILTFIRWYLPGYKSGGPARTVSNMVDRLGSELEFRIVTTDRDMLDDNPYPGVRVDTWNRLGQAHIYYKSPENRTSRVFTKLVSETPHDVLYLNSFFDFTYSLQLLWIRQKLRTLDSGVVIAPRGEFSPGALEIKRWKKEPFRWLMRFSRMYRNVIWHASSEHEAQDIQHAMGGESNHIYIAPNLPPSNAESGGDNKSGVNSPGRPLKLVFLSRISPKKNLTFALQILKRIKASVVFDIYGPVDDEPYWRDCRAIIKKLPRNVQAHYKGSVPHDRVSSTFSMYDLFFFPTRGENFGHVILESLAAKTPVLISDKTPWTEDEKSGCKVISLSDLNGYSSYIEAFARMDGAARSVRMAAARQIADAFIQREDLIEKNRRLFNMAAGKVPFS